MRRQGQIEAPSSGNSHLPIEIEFNVLNAYLVNRSGLRAAGHPVFHAGGADMSIEGEFVRFTSRARNQLAFVRDSIDAGYLDDIHRFEVLEKDHEYELAKRWREHGDRDAAHQLVTSHLRLAVRTAISYRGYGLPISQIISEGNVGVMQALNRFDPERGFRFASYAVWWIRASIQDYILRTWLIVKIGTTANQKKLF